MKNRWLVAASTVGIHLSIGSVYSWSVFSKPITQQMGWSFKDVQLTFSIAILFLGLSAALLGHLVEKYGPRKTGMIAAIFFGAGIGGAGLAIQMKSIVALYFCYGVLGGIGLGVGYIAPVSTLVKWFPDRRGLATGLAIMGFGFASLIAGPVIQELILRIGLANTFFTLGLVYFSIIFASSHYLAPPPLDWMPTGWQGTTERHRKRLKADVSQLSANEAVRTIRFSYLWVMLFINITCGIAVISVASAMAQDSAGMSAATAAMMVGVMGLFNGGGRIAWAYLSDYVGRPNTYTLFFVLQMALFFMLSRTTNPMVFQLLLFLVMTCYGGGFACIPAYIADLFGTKQLGAIHGYILTAWAAAGLAGPIFVAWVRQESGGYSGTLTVFLGLFVIALTLSLLIRLDIRRLAAAKTHTQPTSLASRTFKADLDGVATAIDFIEQCAQSVGLDQSRTSRLHLAVEEATTNICSHAYFEEIAINQFSYAYHTATTFAVRIKDDRDSFIVELTDAGIPFNPLSAAPPDINAPLETRQADGLGILLMRKMVDEIRYAREGDRNLLALVVRKNG